MRPKNVKSLLTHAFRHRLKVLLKGKPGIGKSDLYVQACAEAGVKLMISHPAVSDPTDYKGMPALVEGKAEFLPFGDLRKLCETTEPTVCLLEDLGQTPNATQAAIMQLILARRVNGHTLADCVIFAGATNDTSHMAGVSGLIEPVKSRWHTIVEMEVSLDDWCEWALDNNMPPELIAFLRFRPALLSDFKPTRELTNSPSPRGWASVGQWMNTGIRDLEVFTGCVGQGAATELFAFLDVCSSLPSLDAILMDPDNTAVPEKPAALYAVVSGLSRRATTQNVERIFRYGARLSREFEVCLVRDCQRINKQICNTPAFVTWATRNGDVLA